MAEARSPAATVDTIDEAAVSKSALPNVRLFVMSVLGGMFIAVGALSRSSWPVGRPSSWPTTRAWRAW